MNGEVVTTLTTKAFGLSLNPIGRQATITAAPTVSSSNASDLATCITLVNEIKGDYNNAKIAINYLIARLQAFGLIE